MTFTNFVCLFLVVRSRAGGRRRGRRAEHTAERTDGGPADVGAGRRQDSGDPRANTKTLWAGANAPAHSRLVKTPVLTRTQLSSAQLK